jgi:hypothetical protein
MNNDYLKNCLERFGIKEIENPLKKKFDPKYHEAVSTMDINNGEDNTVVSVLKKGYTIHERVLRATQVVVGKLIKKEENVKVEDVKKEDVKKEDVKKEDVKKEDVKKEEKVKKEEIIKE